MSEELAKVLTNLSCLIWVMMMGIVKSVKDIMRLNKLLIAVLILQHKPLSTLSVLRDTLNVTISGYQLLLSICHWTVGLYLHLAERASGVQILMNLHLSTAQNLQNANLGKSFPQKPRSPKDHQNDSEKKRHKSLASNVRITFIADQVVSFCVQGKDGEVAKRFEKAPSFVVHGRIYIAVQNF